MRALLTVAVAVAVGVGVDREVEALDDFDKLQHAQAWARTGLVFGSSSERATLTPQLTELGERLDVIRVHLDSHPERAISIEQPAEPRWRGPVASGLPPCRSQGTGRGSLANVQLTRPVPLAMLVSAASSCGPTPHCGEAVGGVLATPTHAKRGVGAGIRGSSQLGV